MWRFAIICTVLTVIKCYEAGKIGSNADGAYAGAISSGSANSYVGGYGGGASNEYDFPGVFGGGFVFGGITDPFAFHQQHMASILRQHAAHQNAIVSALSTGDAFINADASFSSNDEQELINQQIAGGNKNANKVQVHASNSGNTGLGGHAAAAGSFGPDGFKQTAFINPANPASPNIMNRFGASENGNGFKAVSVNSFSQSSDINGKRTNVRGAQTTVNDNGKITTYSVHS